MRIVRLLSITLTLVCTLLIAASARAQSGTIAGILVEDGTGTPLSGIPPVYIVTVYNANTGDTEGLSDTTDTNGRYEIAVPVGSYYVKVTHASFHVRELHPNIQCIAADCPLTAGTPVTVTAGATTTVDFSLAREGIIAGTVRRAADNIPLGQVTVQLYNASTSLIGTVPTTALNGAYSFSGLPAGSYFARVVGQISDVVPEVYNGVPCPNAVPESDCRIASGTPIVVTAGVTTSGVDFTLDTGAAISGTVLTDGTSAPIAGLTVTAYLGDIAMASTPTAENGRYTIVGLPAGSYRVRTAVSTQDFVDEWQNGVCVGCPGATPTITLAAGGAATSVDFSLGTGATISGSVACNTAANDQRGPDVLLFDAMGRLMKEHKVPSNSFAVCRTGGTPTAFTFKGLPAGTYYLLAKDVPSQPGGTSLNAGLFIDQLYGGVVCIAKDCDVRRGAPVVVTTGATVSGINWTVQGGSTLALPSEAGIPLIGPTVVYRVFDSRGVELVERHRPFVHRSASPDHQRSADGHVLHHEIRSRERRHRLS